jgi:tetratricopeptide (TPR) repeat protein
MKLALALLLAAAPMGVAHAQNETPAEVARNDKLMQAIRQIQGGAPQKALEVVTPLLAEYESTYPGDPRKMLCRVEEYETAAYPSLPGGKDAKLVDGGWCIALWAKGFALIDLQQLDAALPFLERSVAMAPLHPHYLSELGYAYQAQKQWQRSYELYARAAEAAKRESGDRQKKSLRRAWFGMAYGAIEMGRLDEAETLLRKCQEMVPDDKGVKDELNYVIEQKAKSKKTS